MIEQNPQNQSGGLGGRRSVELKVAVDATQAFLMALRNYGVFPPEHASTLNLMRGLYANLNSCIKRYGALHLGIERERILVDDEVVFEENNPENNPVFVFFQDGILWLEFQEGLELDEIIQFFRIVTRFKGILEDPEGDLVTELWEAEFPHINYGVSENLWEAEPVLEFSLLNPDSPTFFERRMAEELPGFDLLKSILGLIPESSGSERAEELSDGDAAAGSDGKGPGAQVAPSRWDRQGDS